MAESPQERSPGVFSRIGSWLSWGWGGPVLSGDEPTSETQREEASDEDHRETSRPTAGAHERDSPAVGETIQAEKSPSPSRNAKHLSGGREGEDGTGETQVCSEQTSEHSNPTTFVNRRRSTPDFSDKDKTEQMGRRRSGRRRRSSHGDVGGSEPRSPTNTQPDSPATTSLATSPQTACADSAFEEAEISVQECSGAEAPNSGTREDVVRAEWLEAHPSEDAADSQSSADPAADSDMDEEPVVRMTESAESKRRSIKVSHSEKIFAKRVVVTSEDPDEDYHLRLKSTSDPKWPRSDDRARCPEDRVDGTNVKASHQKGRIADKISLFERGGTKAVASSTNLRHLDISPARNVAVRLTEHGGPRSGSAPPNRTVKERAMNFNAGGEKLTLSSGHALSEGHSKTTCRTEASCSGEVKPKPTDQTDSKSHNATQSKPALSESTSDSNIGDRELDQVSCSMPTVSSPSDETPQVKSPNRTSSRSKKRRIKDTTQPLSPTSKNKQDMGQGNTAPNIPPKHLLDAGDVVNTTDQCLKSTSGEELMQSMKTTSNTDSKRLQKTPHTDTKGLKVMKSKERENRDDLEGSASKPLNSQTENSSNEVTIERTGIGKNRNKKQPVQEGEQGEKNRDTIVNTLFGESGKLDPSVTKDEKPPSPEEDVRAANSKDSANSSAASSRKDAMRNRGSETDMLVLPEKDTTTCVHGATNPPGNDPKSERPSKPNYKSEENDSSASKTPKPALVKTQNYEMDAIISPQIPPREGGGPKRGGQSESREEQKVRTALSKRDLQQPELKTSTDNTSKVNGDLNSVEKGDQLSVCLEQSGEQTLSSSHENTQIPPGNDNLTLRSEKKNPPTANEASTSQSDQASEKITSKPASTNETASTVPASTNEFANEKATPLPASATEKATPPPASTNETNSTLPASTNEKATPLANEKATPLPASANEKATPLPASANEKLTPLPASANETATPPPASANEKATPLPVSANEKATPLPASANEKATPLPASANEKATPLPASAKEKATPPPASTNETNSTLPASTNEKATPLPASANKKATPLPASANEKATPLPASAKEKTTPLPASANEKATPPTASTNEKATPLANEKTTPLPASANEKATPLPASANEKTTPLTASTNEETTPPTASTNEETTPPPASTNEATSTLPASTNEKATPLASEKATPLPALANEKATPLPASANEKATPLPASANETATPPPASTNEKATPLPASANEKATPLPASANEKATPLPASANEKATPLQASANEKTTPLPASSNEKTTLLPASANEETTPPPASTNEKTTPLPASANEKTPPLPASANEKTTLLPASANEETTPPPASTNETTSILPASTNKKTVPPPATTDSIVSNDKTTKNERTPPLPASSSFPLTSTNGENITPLPSSIEKSVLPPASIKEMTLPPHASTKEKISPSPSGKSTDPATRKKEFTPKPFFLPQIPSAPGSSSQNRDSPSSWLDVERPIRKKQLISEPKPKLSTSVSKTNRDTSGEFDPDDFIANVKRLAMPFNLPQRKHNKHRLQAPPSVLPAIREDRYEKPFDPEEFQHGLRKRREFILDLAPSSISKSLDKEDKKEDTKPKRAKPERESILTRSLIFQRSRKESKQEEGEKEETVSDESTTEPLKTRSRLERCSIVSILRSSSKGRRMEFLSPTECPSDGLLSPTDDPGSTPPPQTQLAPAAESTERVLVEEVLAKSDGRFTPYGKPSKDVGPTTTPDPKTTSRDQTVMVTDTNAPPSGTQTTPQVLKPTKELDLKTTSPDPRVTDSPPTPSHTQSGSQVVLKHTKNVGPTMKPDLKADPTVTMLTDTNALLHPSGTQTTPQVVLKPTKEDGPTPTTDPQKTSRDQTVMVTDTNALPSDTQSATQKVLKPTKEDGHTQAPDLKTTSPDPWVTDSTPSHTQSGSQVVLKHTKNDGPTMKPDLKADPTVTLLTDTNALLHPSGTQTTPQVVLKPTKDDGLTPTTSADPPVSVLTDRKAPPLPGGIQTSSDVVLQPDGHTSMPDLKTTPVDPIATMITDAPPHPSFEDIKLPSLLEKFLQKTPETRQSSNKIDPLVALESASIPGHVDLNTAVDVANRKTQEVTIPPAPQLPASQILPANLQRELPNIPTARGIHRRPAKIVIFEHHQFNGQSFEFYRDQPDATQMQLSSVISVKVVRGCWIMYEKPGFEGRCIALEEEGVTELPNQWAEEGGETSTPLVIGSIRLAVRDYTPPRIELFTEPAGRGRSSVYLDVTEEVGSFGLPQNTGSIKVHSGLWLVYSDPGFQGLLAVMEAGEYPFPEDWGFAEPIVGSLRPLRMGLPKVENPAAVKAVLYERAGLQGCGVEVQGDVFSFKADPDDHGLTCVESLKILGGLWVGYEREGFDGQQFLLEEGEYLDWRDWGGTGQKLLSLRPVLMDFSSPHMKMFSELDFSERGVNIDLLEPLENVSDTHFGPQTGSIEVLAGVWVVFEEPGFSGRQYVLEKGLYGSPEDWGASDGRISSAVPVTLENLEHSCHFQIQLFSEPGLDGTSVVLQDSLPTMPEGFSVRSCRVFAGSWLAFSSECFSGRQCVLEEGVYPDLRTMGFTQPNTSVLSIHPTGHEFSLPSVVLFERSGLKGRRTLLKSSSVNLQLTDSCTRVSSILVEGGMWVLYEASNFRGSQFLLKPGTVPDWPKLSSWRRIGSLRPLMQKQTLFRLRNEEAGLMMAVTGSLEDIKLMRIQVSEETGGTDQIWAYQDGRLQCKWLPDCCVDVGSGVLMPGTRAVLSSEPGKPQQLWNISSDGIIRSNAAPHLVLEVKGGQQFDKSQIILNEFHPNKMNQRWSLEIL